MKTITDQELLQLNECVIKGEKATELVRHDQ